MRFAHLRLDLRPFGSNRMLRGGKRVLRARMSPPAALQQANLRRGWGCAYMPALF